MRRARTRAMVTLVVAVMVGGLAARARAYETKHSEKNGVEVRWHSLPMKFNIHLAAAPGVSAAVTRAAVRASYQTWSKVNCSTFDTLDLGVVDNPYGSRSDGVNTNTWVPSWPTKWPTNALAMTLTAYGLDTGKITDADTQYNPGRQWSDDGSALAYDIQAIATHEIGHQLGLAHSQVPEATMYYATGKGDTSLRSLHSDDIAGVCYLYPSGQTTPDECDKDADCGPGETCDQGSCVAGSETKKGYGGLCASGTQCLSGFCIQTAEGDTLCSQLCASEPCPNGDDCVKGSAGATSYQICKPNTAKLSQPLGSPCLTKLQCESGLCVSVSGQGDICSQACDVATNDCPSGYVCAPSDIGGLCVPEPNQPPVDPPPPPTPATGEPLGASCAAHLECQSKLCVPATATAGKVCTQRCEVGQPAACPAGMACVAVGGGQGGCLPTAPPAPGPGCEGGCPEGSTCVSNGDGTSACRPIQGPVPESNQPGGCAVVAGARDHRAPTGALLLLVLLALVSSRSSFRRRRRIRRRGVDQQWLEMR